MKNPLALIKSSPVVTKTIEVATKIYLEHESLILTSGTIGFGMASTAIAMKNAVKINEIVIFAKEALAECNTKEEKNDVYKLFLREMAPLVAPIIFFQGAMIACSIVSKRKLDLKNKKIAELAGALSIAQTAVTQYQTFAHEAEQSLGEKKYDKLQKDISEKVNVDGRRFNAFPSEGAPGQVLLIDKYTGRPFWGTVQDCKIAAERLSDALTSGRDDVVTIEDWHINIGNNDLMGDGESGVLTTKFGYRVGTYGYDDICAKFDDAHYVYPNGTVVPAFIVRLYPEPACVDEEID